MKLSVVIPVYNEVATVAAVVERVRAAQPEAEIVVVDDGSTDGTTDVLKELSVAGPLKVLMLGRNRGKGYALRKGFAETTGDVILIQDADLEYDPCDYERLLQPIIDGKADVVYGSRFLGGPHRVLLFWHYVGNRLLTLLSNMLCDVNLSDMETCYKAFRRTVLVGMRLREDRFGFEPEFTAKVAKAGFRVYEVPVSYSGRTYEEGKKVKWTDGVAAVWSVLRYGSVRNAKGRYPGVVKAVGLVLGVMVVGALAALCLLMYGLGLLDVVGRS